MNVIYFYTVWGYQMYRVKTEMGKQKVHLPRSLYLYLKTTMVSFKNKSLSTIADYDQ